MTEQCSDLFEHVPLNRNFKGVDAEGKIVRSAVRTKDIQYWHLRSETDDLDAYLMDLETVASDIQLYLTNDSLTCVVRGFFQNDSERRQSQVVMLVSEFSSQDFAQRRKAELDVQSGGSELKIGWLLN